MTEINRIVDVLESHDIDLYDVDELIYELAEEEGRYVAAKFAKEVEEDVVDATLNKATELNHQGLTGQVQYLVKTCGIDAGRRLLGNYFGVDL